MSDLSECTVIVPIRATACAGLSDLVNCYAKAIDGASILIDVLLIDNSPEEIGTILRELCRGTKIQYVFLPHADRISKNQKMDAVWYALRLDTADKIILFDDDARPSAYNIECLCSDLDRCAFAKCIIDFVSPTVFDRIDLAGLYAYNFLSRSGQIWANISFRKALLFSRGFPRRDVLYDELAIQNRFRNQDELFYRDSPPVVLKQNRGLRLFLNQRGRYAYENIASPIRFSVDLCVLPALAGLNYFAGSYIAFLVGILITCGVMWASWAYERRLPHTSLAGRVWPFAGAWYWFYPVFSWVAFVRFLTGGIAFHHKRIWRPV